MALKITKQIGTDRGITKEAYVRINSYSIQKAGTAVFGISLYMSDPSNSSDKMMDNICVNRDIGSQLVVEMTKQAIRTRVMQRTVQREVAVTETVSILNNDQEKAAEVASAPRTEMRPFLEDFEEEYTVTVPDLSPLETVFLFEFAYGKLREKLASLFGASNIVNC